MSNTVPTYRDWSKDKKEDVFLWSGLRRIGISLQQEKNTEFIHLWSDIEPILDQYQELAEKLEDKDRKENVLAEIAAIRAALKAKVEVAKAISLVHTNVEATKDTDLRQILGFARYELFSRERGRAPSEEQRHDPYFMFAYCISEHVYPEFDYVHKCVPSKAELYGQVPLSLRSDREFVLELSIYSPVFFDFADDELRNDFDFFVNICEQKRAVNGQTGRRETSAVKPWYSPIKPGEKLLADKEKMRQLISRWPYLIQYCSGDSELVDYAYSLDADIRSVLPKEIAGNYAEVKVKDEEQQQEICALDGESDEAFISRMLNVGELFGYKIDYPSFIKKYGSNKSMIKRVLIEARDLDVKNGTFGGLFSTFSVVLDFLWEGGTPALASYEFCLEIITEFKCQHPRYQTKSRSNKGDLFNEKSPQFMPIIMQLLENGEDYILELYPTLRANYTVVLKAVTNNGWQYEFVSPELKTDRTIILAAVRENPAAYKFVPNELKLDDEIIAAVLGRDLPSSNAMVSYLPSSVLANEQRLVRLYKATRPEK